MTYTQTPEDGEGGRQPGTPMPGSSWLQVGNREGGLTSPIRQAPVDVVGVGGGHLDHGLPAWGQQERVGGEAAPNGGSCG